MKVLDEMNLPLANPNEELEDISINHFKPLFDIKRFQIRQELIRDKGIDFRIELKRQGTYTGFNFAIQLKATEKIEKNEEGSVSLSIYSSNINILLNFGLPAYYVLYFKRENVFLYENVNAFVAELVKKDEQWQHQETHVLRFRKELTPAALDDIHQTTLDRGVFLRTLNQKLFIDNSLIAHRVTVDQQLSVFSDAEIRRLIEGYGLHLINEAKWMEVLDMHRKGTQQIAATAKYNLVIGIAYYYAGQLIDAMKHIKTAMSLKAELDADLQEHLAYFDAMIRVSIGLIDKKEYETRLSLLGKTDHVRYYVKIEKIKAAYVNSKDDDIDKRYEQFEKDMAAVQEDEHANDNIKLLARCEMVLFRGSKINMDYARGIALTRAREAMIGPNSQLRIGQAGDMLLRKIAWAREAGQIKDEALESKNYFVFFHVLVNETKVNYEFEAYTDLFAFDTPGVHALDSERRENLIHLVNNLDKSIRYFSQIKHVENWCVALSIKYEILHYMKEMLTASDVLDELSRLIDTYELGHFRQKLDALKNDGTTHQKIIAFFDSVSAEFQQKENEYNALIADMQRMDQLDEQTNAVIEEPEYIHLLPIYYFKFPKAKRDKVFEILHMTPEGRVIFNERFDEGEIIPIANLYQFPISFEGYGDDIIQSSELTYWRVIHQIRKAFFDNGFPRARITP